MRPTYIIKLLTCIILCIIFLLPTQVLAQNTSPKELIKVSPVILHLDLAPGKTEHYTITVENLLNAPLPLSASVEGFDASDEDYGFKTTDLPTTSPLISWINLDTTDAILSAHESRQFDITINIPKKVEIGAYYAVIFFTPNLPTDQTSVNARIGVIALANIGVPEDQRDHAKIVTFDWDQALFQANPVNFTLRVQNTSLNYFAAKPTLTIQPVFGRAQTFELNEKTVLPGKVRRWQQSISLSSIFPGIYLAKLTVGVGDNQVSITNQFYVFPLTRAVIAIGFIIIIGLLIWKRKNLRLVWKALVKG